MGLDFSAVSLEARQVSEETLGRKMRGVKARAGVTASLVSAVTNIWTGVCNSAVDAPRSRLYYPQPILIEGVCAESSVKFSD